MFIVGIVRVNYLPSVNRIPMNYDEMRLIPPPEKLANTVLRLAIPFRKILNGFECIKKWMSVDEKY